MLIRQDRFSSSISRCVLKVRGSRATSTPTAPKAYVKSIKHVSTIHCAAVFGHLAIIVQPLALNENWLSFNCHTISSYLGRRLRNGPSGSLKALMSLS